MTSTSTESLRDRVAGVTADNTSGDPVAPPGIAAVSPFHEILAMDVAATLPPELRRLVSATTSMDGFTDWIAAGAMLSWLRDEHSRRVYLGELQRDPRRASLSLARAVASRMEPPRREREWCRLDLAGLVLQLAATMAVLLCRAFMVAGLGFWLSGQTIPRDWFAPVAAGILDLPVLLSGAPPGIAFASALLAIGVWHTIEVCWVPLWIENARQVPLRMRKLPASTPWRHDTFQAAWLLQAAAFWLIAGILIAQQAFFSGEDRVALVVFLGLHLIPSAAIARRLREAPTSVS